MELKQIVDKYLTENYESVAAEQVSGNFSWKHIAQDIANQENINVPNKEYVRNRWRKIQKKSNNLSVIDTVDYARLTIKDPKQSVLVDFTNNQSSTVDSKFKYISGKEDSKTKEFTFTADKIPTTDEIISHFNIDTTKFRVNQIYHKTSFGGAYSITVSLLSIKGVEEQKDFKEAFKQFVNDRNISILNKDLSFLRDNKVTNKEIENALILSLSDLHLDSKSYEGEVGTETGMEISIKRAKDAVKDILYRASYGHGLEKIIIIGGNDFFHANSAENTTQKGTPLDVDNRWTKSFKQGLELISWIIDLAVTFAPVDYYTCYGNHSPEREFYLAVALEALYRNNKQVNIETGESTRKYFKYGNSAFMLCHDAPKKVKDCPTIFITEQPKLYADAKYRFLLTGHLHSKQETFFISTSENFGLLWKRLPSLSKIDKWHFDNFFIGNQKSAIGLVINKNHGEIAEYIYNE